MRYTIENEFIRLTVDSLGAEMVSVIDVATGREMLWCADPTVWESPWRRFCSPMQAS